MNKVFIVHGFEGSPNGGWRPWLMAELQKLDVYACALAMPKAHQPKLTDWISEIARHVEENPKDHIYLVGHSLGVPTILRYLEQSVPKNVKGAILVSGPIETTDNKKITDFLRTPINFKKIALRTKKFAVIHGHDDPLVPLDQAKVLSKNLGAKLVIIRNGGHLNGSAGWYKLPPIMTALKGMMK